MKWFILPAGIWILIDKIDIHIVQSCGWHLTNWGYVRATTGKYRGKYLHKIIAERMGFDVFKLTDHKDLNKFNNQRSNLREATKSQNAMNSKINSNNTSGYTGVHSHGNKSEAIITVKRKRIYLGLFDTPEEAHKVRREAEIKYFGEFGNYG